MQMTTTVNPTNVLIGPEFVPRFLNLPMVKQVVVGQTWTPPEGTTTLDYLEIAGTVTISRDYDTVLKVTHLIILPGGLLDSGTDVSPMFPGHFELIGRDVPIDVTVDPFHWGNGLLNFGTRYMVGPTKTPWGIATSDVLAGATTVTLTAAPNNWELGDEVLIPDMDINAASRTGTSPPRRETPGRHR